MHICFHQLSNDVDVLEACPGWWFRNVEDLDDVLMVEELQQLNLSNDTFRIDKVLERLGDFFDSNLDLGLMIESAAHYTVCSVPDLFNVFKFILDEESRSCKLVSDQENAYPRI